MKNTGGFARIGREYTQAAIEMMQHAGARGEWVAVPECVNRMSPWQIVSIPETWFNDPRDEAAGWDVWRDARMRGNTCEITWQGQWTAYRELSVFITDNDIFILWDTGLNKERESSFFAGCGLYALLQHATYQIGVPYQTASIKDEYGNIDEIRYNASIESPVQAYAKKYNITDDTSITVVEDTPGEWVSPEYDDDDDANFSGVLLK